MERIGGKVVWEGRICRVRVDRFRYEDGEEAEREIVEHPGSAGVVVHDGETLYLVRQPRECHLFMATNLYDEEADVDEDERIEIVQVPLSDLDSVIRDCRDSKTLVGLLWLRASLNR